MTEQEGFDAFWEFWRQTKRHTDGRGKCRKEYWRQLSEGATAEDILLGAQWHVRNTKDLAYIPLASSWLHSEAWRDEAPKERVMVARQEQRALEQSAANVVQMPKPALPANHFSRQWEKKQQEG